MKAQVITAAVIGSLAALVAGCGSSPSSAKPTQVSATTASALSVTSVSPAVIPVATASTLTVYGTGFQSSTTVLVDALSVATTYVSGTELTATVPSTQFPVGSIVPVTASDHGVLAGSGGTLEVDNPKPVLSQTFPASATTGGGSVVVAMTGSGFSTGTTAMFSGAARPTTYISPTQLSVTLTAADAATAGSFPMTVVNPVPGGGSSTASGFLITNPVPTISSTVPTSLSVGASPASITVLGSGFMAGTTVLVNGTARTTIVGSGTQLSFVSTVADTAVGTTLQVALQNPAPGGGISAKLAVPVKNPTPSIAAIAPLTITAGTSAPTTVSLTGTSFVAGATVSVAGSSRSATVLSATSLNFPVSTAEQATAGSLPIVVTNPAPGGGASAPASLSIANPVPSVGALSPSTIPVGTALATIVSLGGSGFAPGATVSVNGVSRAAAVAGTAKLSFSVAAAEVATVASLPVVVTNPSPGGGSSATVNLAVTGTVPVITALAPASLVAGASTSTTVTLSGSNFSAAATASVNGVSRMASVASSTSLTFPVTAAETAAFGTLAIVVTNPNPGGGSSLPASLVVSSPQPGALTLSPSTVLAGAKPPATVSVTGTNFIAASSVSVGGMPRPATVVNGKTISFVLTAADLATAGTLPVVVINPSPSGALSSPAATLTVANPVPGTLVLSPSTILLGTSGPVAVAVNGTNFVSGSAVLVGGTSRAATYTSATRLTFTLTTADLTTAGTLPVVVANPGPGGGSSPASTITVANPQPGSISVSPTTIVAGTTTPVTVAVSGSSFVASSSVLVNGKSRSTSSVTSTSLTFVLSATDLATPGTLTIAVGNPLPGGGVTAAVSIVLSNPVPGTIAVSPASVAVAAVPSLLSISGSNFEPGVRVLVNGSARATTLLSTTQITAQLLAADQAATGTLAVSVTNPTPGGGTSNTVQLPVVNPVPGTLTLSPSGSTAGATVPLTVAIAGSGFVQATVVQVNGNPRTTAFVSAILLTTQLTVADQATAVDLPISVFTPAPGGGTSAAVTFHVQNPVPVIASLAPSAVLAGTSATTSITVTGSRFVTGAVVSVNGIVHATTFASATSLALNLSVAEQATGGVLSLTVTNPSPGGGFSNVATIAVNNPAPGSAITVSPSSIPVGTTTPTTVTVSGTAFVRGAAVTVAGVAHTASYVSATRLTIALTAAEQATATTLSVVAANPTPGGGSTGSATITIANPLPGPITLAPGTLAVSTSGSTSTITVTGSNFIAGSAVMVNGTPHLTTFKSATQLTFTTLVADQAVASTLHVTVTNAAPGGGTTAAVSLPVTNPLPVLTAASPTAVAVGGATGTPVTLTGSGFVSTSTVQVNGVSHAATFVSPTQLTVALTAAEQASASTLSIIVVNAAPGGGTSSAVSVSVAYLQPTITALTPASVSIGVSTPTQVTVTGANYLAGATVQVNGASRVTSYRSVTSVTFALTVADQSAAALLAITVTNPAPSNRVSAPFTLLVGQRTSTPTITSISPASAIVGASATTLTVNGTNLGSTSIVQWNGSSLATSLSGTSLIVQVPATLLGYVGSAILTVVNPTATPTTSNTATFTISNPPAPVLTGISPAYGAINAAQTLSLAGTGFQPNTTLQLNGTALATTFVNSTTLTVSVPAGSLALPGNYAFNAVTPSPGGGISSTAYFTAYIPVVSNSMVYNSANGLFYLSIPGSAGAPLGNSIVSLDPATGTLGSPIYVGSEPNKLALTADGTGLWVGLDGAAAVRRVDLAAGTAGLQFQLALNPSTGYVDLPPVALSLVALPGSPNSVVVQASAGSPQFAIYDSGTLRSAGSPTRYTGPASYTPRALALQANTSTGELYSGGTGLNTYTFSSAGLSYKATNSTPALASLISPEMQLNNGRLYTDFGAIYDAETGTVAGLLTMSGTTAAIGPTFADTGTGRIFVLDQPSSNPYDPLSRIQVFNLSDNTLQASTVPLNMPALYQLAAGGTIAFPQGVNGLSRWGANGLAVRSFSGVFSVQSNAVTDVSAIQSDLAISASSSTPVPTGTAVPINLLVTNHGSAPTSGVAVQISAPSLGSVSSVSTTLGTCSIGSPTLCSLGTLANGATAIVTVNVLEADAGTSTLTAAVTGSNTDPLPINNSVEVDTGVTGSHYNVAPTVASLSPSSIQAGAANTTITVKGSGFSGGATVLWNGTSLATTYISATQLTAVIPASSIAALGWGAVTVSTPAPGGGVSNALPFSVYTVTSVLANSIVYEPFSRRIFASVNTNSTTVAGNSVVAIQPETGTVGAPVHVGSQPTRMAVSSDGNELYTLLTGTAGLSRINLLTGTADLNVTFPATGVTPQDIATLPNSDTVVAIDGGTSSGIWLYDINQSAGTAIPRTATTSTYAGTCLNFYDSSRLYSVDTVANGDQLYSSSVSAGGLTTGYTNGSTLNSLGCSKIDRGLIFGRAGAVADPSTSPVSPLGVFQGVNSDISSTPRAFAADRELGRAFFPVATGANNSATVDGIAAYNATNYQLSGIVSLGVAAAKTTPYNGEMEMLRWGQDGLALLSSDGHLYLMRGGFVLPQLLSTGTTALFSGRSSPNLTHGSGNTLLTISGGNFLPGVAITWNGSYRTTTLVDSTHVTVDIPASDLASAGIAVLVAINPGASPSGALDIVIQ